MNPVVKKHQSIINVIAHCIEKDEEGIRNLLKRNGVKTSAIKGKQALRKAFINALAKSRVVALDFNRYIEAKKKTSNLVNASGMFSNDLNLDDLKLNTNVNNPFANDQPNGFGEESILANTTPYNNTKTGSGFFSDLNLKDLINTGVSILEIQRDIKLSNDNKEAVESAVQIKQDEINLQPQSTSSSVGVWVAIGLIGITVVGGIIYVATKK